MRQFFDKFLLLLAALFAPWAFWGYRLAVTLLVVAMGVAPVYGLLGWFCPALTQGTQVQRIWMGGVLAVVGLILLGSFRLHTKDNPHRLYVGLSGWVNKRVDRLIAWIGTIKYFKHPLCLVEDPGSYKIKGDEIRALIDGGLQPGDILLRGYDGYLDGVMIGLSGGGANVSRRFSHAALYLGDLDDARDKPIVARRLQVMDAAGHWREATETDPDYYQPGRQRVLHAMTRGVFTEDILSFVRCDYLAVLRLPETMQLNEEERQEFSPLIGYLAEDALSIQRQLMDGRDVSRQEVLQRVHLSALGKTGSCYDFQFTDGKTQHRFSCSEFVYYCFKSVHAYIGLRLVKHGLMGVLFIRETITPGDIYDAAEKTGKLRVVWKSRSLQG
jgi:hypothetical protein